MTKLHDIASRKRKNKKGILDDIIYRWSPKSMTGEGVSDQDLAPLFEAARWAPSSNNNQEWHFYYALRKDKVFRDLFELLTPGNQEWCDRAGALMILVSQKIADYKDKPIRTHAFDTGMAFEVFAIEGLRRNLVVHPMGGFDREFATKYLKLNTDRFEVQIMIAVGKPHESVVNDEIKDRKKISEIAHRL